MHRWPLVALLSLWMSSAWAQAPVPPPSPALPAPNVVTIEKHASMQVGARATLIVRVALPKDAGDPVLLTTASEGSALEVVRGRFVRLDAEDPNQQTLRFAVPVVARAAGTAIFRAHVLYYRCTTSCTAVEQEAEASIEIAPAP